MYAVEKLYTEKRYTLDTGELRDSLGGYAIMFDNQVITNREAVPFTFRKGQPVPEVWPCKMTAQKIADRKNGKACEFPKAHTRALKAAFKTTESAFYPGYYYVTEKTSNYLCDRLGLGTDWCEHNIMDTFKCAFDWRLQKWMVKA